ncbi:hypothetical protein NMY22_g18707 [Coprinellus aureogranulatus]|nr:hypothetical protein NMY22_g18707 [Coprinellus aureogranulatus]
MLSTNSPSLPQPSLPDIYGPRENLRRVLNTWNNGGYKTQPKVPLLAYILSHKYSAAELQHGERCLKGKDAFLVENLLPVTRDLDFSVCLAHLTKTVKGDADEERKNGQLVMINVEEDTKEISRLVRISSETPFKVGYFNVEDDVVIPKDFFETVYPDEEDFEGYTGNEGAPLEWQYFRSAIVLFRNADQTAVVTRVKGLPWVIEHQESKSLNLDLRVAASTALDCLRETQPRRDYEYGPVLAAVDGVAEELAQLAIDWKDRGAVGQEASIKEALQVFDLDPIRPTLLRYVALVYSHLSFDWRLRAIRMISDAAGSKASSAWVDALTRDALAEYTTVEDSDAWHLATLALEKGLDLIHAILIPNLSAGDEMKGTYPFFIKLAQALYNLRERSRCKDATEPTMAVEDEQLTDTVHQCLLEALKRWQLPMKNSDGHEKSHLERVQEIVDVCLLVQDLGPCNQLLTSLLVLQPDGDIAARFRDFYSPLILKVKATLKKRGKEATSEPFLTFFKNLIILYLERILGTPEVAPPLPRLHLSYLVGEGPQAEEFMAFANSPHTGPIRISGVSTDKLRWFTRTMEKDDPPVTMTVELTDRLRKRYTLTLEKQPEASIPYTWESRRTAARTFLDSIGNEDEMKVILGERYGDVKRLLDSETVVSGNNGLSEGTA